MRKSVKIAVFLLLAAAHFLLSLGLFFSSFASTMDQPGLRGVGDSAGERRGLYLRRAVLPPS